MLEQLQKPPVAKTVPYEFEHGGKSFSDPYTWLQDKSDPEVIAYLEAENDYTRLQLSHTEALQEQLYQEMRGRLQEDDSTVPEPRGEYEYYSRLEAGRQYRLFCRKHRASGAEEELLIDENALAKGLAYCRVYVFEPSPDGNFLAYSVDTTGAWVFTLYIKDLRTGELAAGPVGETAWTAAWASDSRTLFYTRFDAAHRADRLFRLPVGDKSGQGTEVFHEPDEAFNLQIRRTRSGEYLFLTSESSAASEVRYLPAGLPLDEFRLIQTRRPWVRYYAAHHGERFLIWTDEEAENFKLMEAPAAAPQRANWREILPHRTDTLIESVAAFERYLVVYERRAGLQQVRISDPDGITNVRYLSYPDPAYMIKTAANPEYRTNRLRFHYSSLVTPESTVDAHLTGGEWEVKKRQEIPSGYDPSQYVSERLFAAAPDGAQVPISLVYRKGFERDGSRPLLLYGYGSYGHSIDPGFNPLRLSLLDRGFTYAIAHIRGGSELGRAWYENGRLMHKKNTFTDFIACAEHLIAQGYTSSERLAIMGRSAGGLLVSAAINMRPDLFKAVVAGVPFTNVITAMLDPDLPLTVIEYEQWGSPHDPQAFEYMLSYSPYENVEAKEYPQIFVKAGLNDLQVPYWDPAKWVAKLRAHKTGSNRLLLLTNMGAGHSGASGRYDHLREDAQEYAFLIDALEVEES
jgi:oligopeptidase B